MLRGLGIAVLVVVLAVSPVWAKEKGGGGEGNGGDHGNAGGSGGTHGGGGNHGGPPGGGGDAGHGGGSTAPSMSAPSAPSVSSPGGLGGAITLSEGSGQGQPGKGGAYGWLTPAQARTDTDSRACLAQGHYGLVQIGRINTNGSFTFGGYEYALPPFAKCMKAKGYAGLGYLAEKP